MAVQIPVDGSISNAALSSDGRLLAIATTTSLRKNKNIAQSTKVEVADPGSGSVITSRIISTQTFSEPVTQLQRRLLTRPHYVFFTPDDRGLVVYDGSDQVKLLDASTLSERKNIPVALDNAAFPVDIKMAAEKPLLVMLVAINGSDLELRLLDYQQGKQVANIPIPKAEWSYGTALAVNDDGGMAAISLRRQKKIAIYTAGEPLRYISTPVALGSIAFGASGVICGGPLERIDVRGDRSQGAVCLQTSDGQVLAHLKSPDGAVYDQVMVSADKRLLAGLVLFGKHDQEGFPERPERQMVTVWEIGSGKVVWQSGDIRPVLIHHPSFVLSKNAEKIAIFTKGFAGAVAVSPINGQSANAAPALPSGGEK